MQKHAEEGKKGMILKLQISKRKPPEKAPFSIELRSKLSTQEHTYLSISFISQYLKSVIHFACINVILKFSSLVILNLGIFFLRHSSKNMY